LHPVGLVQWRRSLWAILSLVCLWSVDIPLVVCPLTHPSQSPVCTKYSLCAWGLGLVCYIWCNFLVLSGVQSEFKCAPILSLSPPQWTGALGLCLRTTWPDDSCCP
jgi:hypothetical protein